MYISFQYDSVRVERLYTLVIKYCTSPAKLPFPSGEASYIAYTDLVVWYTDRKLKKLNVRKIQILPEAIHLLLYLLIWCMHELNFSSRNIANVSSNYILTYQ